MRDTKQNSFLKYYFFIEEGVWTSIQDFEKWMQDSLEAIGAEGLILNNIKGSSLTERVVHVISKPTPPAPPSPPVVKNQGSAPAVQMKQLVKDYPQSRRFRRKFRPNG